MKILTIFLLMVFSSLSNASLIKLSFEATDFVDCCNNQVTPPQETVIGYFIWEAQDEFSNIIRLIDVDLTVDGYNYNLSDIGFDSFSSFRILGGLEDNGYGCDIGCVILDSRHDFRLDLDLQNPQQNSFTYTGGPKDYGVWTTNSVTSSISKVPEPSSLLLLLPCFLLLRMRR